MADEQPERAKTYSDLNSPFQNVTGALDMSWASGDGAMASTSRDLITWGRALFDGRVLKPETLDTMLADPVDMGSGKAYAQGIISITTPDGLTAYSHDGATLGGMAVFIHIPEKNATFSVLVNQRSENFLPDPYVNRILEISGLLGPNKRMASSGNKNRFSL